MCSDSKKNMSAFADQNHAPSLTCVRLEFNVNKSIIGYRNTAFGKIPEAVFFVQKNEYFGLNYKYFSGKQEDLKKEMREYGTTDGTTEPAV